MTSSMAGWIARHQLWLLALSAPLLIFPSSGLLVGLGLGLILLSWLCRWIALGHLTRHTPLDVPIVLLLAALALGFAVSADWTASAPALWRHLFGVSLFYGLVNGLDRSRALLRLTWLLMAAAGGLLLITFANTNWAIVRLLDHPIYTYLPRVATGLATEQYINPRVAGMALAMLAPTMLAIALFSSRRSYRFVAIGLALLMVAVLALAQSLQGLLGLALAVSLVLVARSRWFLLVLLPPAALLVGAATALTQSLLAGTLLSVESPLGIVLRVDIWSRALSMLQDMPFTGIGLDSYQLAQVHFYPGYLLGPEHHAHNLFLQVALDSGLLGLIAFIWLLLAFWWTSAQAYRSTADADSRSLLVGAAAGVVAMVGAGLVDSLWTAKPAVILWLLLAAGVVVADLSPPIEIPQDSRRRWAPSALAGLAAVLLVLALAAAAGGLRQRNAALVLSHRALLPPRAASTMSPAHLQRAAESLQAAQRQLPGDPDIPAQLGSLYAWLGADSAALEALQRRVELDRDHALGRYAPFEAWRRRLAGEAVGDPVDDLARVYTQWMTRYPDRAEGYVLVAIVQDRYQDNRPGAITVLQSGLERNAQPSGLLTHYLSQLQNAQ